MKLQKRLQSFILYMYLCKARTNCWFMPKRIVVAEPKCVIFHDLNIQYCTVYLISSINFMARLYDGRMVIFFNRCKNH